MSPKKNDDEILMALVNTQQQGSRFSASLDVSAFEPGEYLLSLDGIDARTGRVVNSDTQPITVGNCTSR